MLKRIFANKMLLTAILTCLFAFVSMITIGYAWFTNFNNAHVDPFVSQVGTLGSSYEFGQILGTSVDENDSFRLDDVMPGRTFTFVLLLRNESDVNGNISVHFSDVGTYNYSGNDTTIVPYTGLDCNKIQYSYEYSIKRAYWVPNSDYIGDLTIENQNDPFPTQEEIIENGWSEFVIYEDDGTGNQVARSIYNWSPYFDDENDTQIFNLVDEEGNDQLDYPLISNVPVNDKDSINSSFIIFFQVHIKNLPTLPRYNNLETSELTVALPEGKTLEEFLNEFDTLIYMEQQFIVDNVVITANLNN